MNDYNFTNDKPAMDNNLYYYPNGANCGKWDDGSALATLTDWKNYTWTHDGSSVTGDPKFTSPTTGDLSISSGSAAIAAGVPGLETYDIRGATRGNPPSMGAYDFTGLLPINLLMFNTTCENGQSVISWKTATEINNDKFTVEKSADGTDFTLLTTIPGAGNSNKINTYSVLDMNPFPNGTYYRLLQTDYDGKENFIGMDYLVCNSTSLQEEPRIVAVANNGNGNIRVMFTAYPDVPYEIQVVDLTGRIVEHQFGNGVDGINEFQLDKAKYSQGIYCFVALMNSTRLSTKVMVER